MYSTCIIRLIEINSPSLPVFLVFLNFFFLFLELISFHFTNFQISVTQLTMKLMERHRKRQKLKVIKLTQIWCCVFRNTKNFMNTKTLYSTSLTDKIGIITGTYVNDFKYKFKLVFSYHNVESFRKWNLNFSFLFLFWQNSF